MHKSFAQLQKEELYYYSIAMIKLARQEVIELIDEVLQAKYGDFCPANSLVKELRLIVEEDDGVYEESLAKMQQRIDRIKLLSPKLEVLLSSLKSEVSLAKKSVELSEQEQKFSVAAKLGGFLSDFKSELVLQPLADKFEKNRAVSKLSRMAPLPVALDLNTKIKKEKRYFGLNQSPISFDDKPREDSRSVPKSLRDEPERRLAESRFKLKNFPDFRHSFYVELKKYKILCSAKKSSKGKEMVLQSLPDKADRGRTASAIFDPEPRLTRYDNIMEHALKINRLEMKIIIKVRKLLIFSRKMMNKKEEKSLSKIFQFLIEPWKIAKHSTARVYEEARWHKIESIEDKRKEELVVIKKIRELIVIASSYDPEKEDKWKKTLHSLKKIFQTPEQVTCQSIVEEIKSLKEVKLAQKRLTSESVPQSLPDRADRDRIASVKLEPTMEANDLLFDAPIKHKIESIEDKRKEDLDFVKRSMKLLSEAYSDSDREYKLKEAFCFLRKVYLIPEQISYESIVEEIKYSKKAKLVEKPKLENLSPSLPNKTDQVLSKKENNRVF